MEQRPILVLVGRQRPHNVMLLIFSLGVGLIFLAGFPPPPSVQEGLSDPFILMWTVGLAASGLIGLTGAYWRGGMRRGLMLERSAMLIGAGATFGYAWTVSTAGKPSLFASGFCLSWGIANLARAVQISQDLRSLGREKDAGGNAERSGADDLRTSGWGSDGTYPCVLPPTQRSGRLDGNIE